MNGFMIMLKMNMKLLIRNKAYLCFLIILPICAILTLNIPNDSGYESNDKATYEVKTMENINDQIIKMQNTQLTVKVYDSSSSYLSDYVLEKLASFGSYQIYRYENSEISEDDAEDNALETFNKNNISAAIYISDKLISNVINRNNQDDIIIYEGADDERISLLKDNLNLIVRSLYNYSSLSEGNEELFKNILNESKDKEIISETVKVNDTNEINLTPDESSKVTNIGWSLAIVSLVFLFSGIFISSIIINERNNKVFKRSLLTNMHITSYGAVKVILCIITVVIQLIFMGIGIKLFVRSDFGIPFSKYLFFVFCLGLIFNLLSIVVGTLATNVLTCNYIAFFVWCMTNILAGTYFKIDNASDWWQGIAYLMPQRWIMKCSEMIMASKGEAIPIMVLMTFSFIIVILSIGAIGIKVTKSE